MTDNEIIKALERCPQHTECCYCNSLEECGNKRILTTSVFDLINRQKAEIESLKHRKTELQIRNQELQHEKSEAIKEFAEELEYFVLNEDIEVAEPKCKDYESYINGANQFRHQIKNGINSLVKERTEVETNQRKEDEGKCKLLNIQ